MDKPISYKGSEPYIFVSYAHKDSDAVWPIIARMQGDGYRVWYDDGIDPGTEWDENIASHVEGCGYFIVFLSPAYLESENCRDELNFARDLGKERLLVYLSEVTLPAGMQMRLSRLQAIHWYTYENGNKAFSKLYETQGLDTCRGKADQTAAPSPKVPSADPDATFAEDLYRIGWEYYKRKDFSNAFPYYLKAAQMGYPPAQCDLGLMYYSGDGVSQDKEKAVQWYRKAVEQNFAIAQLNLGLLYAKGEGVPQNAEEAVRLFRKAAEQGNAVAHYSLGIMLYNGKGVPQNTEEALRWFHKAAAQGYALAKQTLENF